MSASRRPSHLSEFLKVERKRYLEGRRTDGGTAEGFRTHINGLATSDPLRFTAFAHEAVMVASTQVWETQPRQFGPDLFSYSTMPLPEFITRPAHTAVGGDVGLDSAAEQLFEKVDQKYATLSDVYENARIKSRKATQAAAAAERLYEIADIASRRAGGNMSAFMRDLADPPSPPEPPQSGARPHAR